LHTGDGHPSFNGRFVAFDTYPDKSRMQKLYLYDIAENIVIPVVELFQNIKYKNETRCDLHPRFSNDGRLLFFDSVYSGQRTLNYIDLTPFYRNY
jgi:Tol biopolymer transport system component